MRLYRRPVYDSCVYSQEWSLSVEDNVYTVSQKRRSIAEYAFCIGEEEDEEDEEDEDTHNSIIRSA